MDYIIGVDEVGRGPLAGPVIVAAVAMPKELRIRNKELGKFRDSKKLTAAKRALWADWLKLHPKINYTLSRVNPRRIERWNISRAANRAAYNACNKLIANNQLPIASCRIYLDGGLYPKNSKVSLLSKTIIRGDEKISVIKAASILAKVQRDRFMVRLSQKYPQYGFEKHKGYGTKAHYLALKKYGPTKTHRRSFL